MRVIKRFVRAQLERYFFSFARKSDIAELYAQIAALLEVRDVVGPGVSFGPLHGWALSADALTIILRDIGGRNRPRVIEFGAGESTIVIAAALRKMDAAPLITIEHDPQFLAGIAQRLVRAGLREQVDLRATKLLEYPARMNFAQCKSYDLSGLHANYDVAIVDGPITHVHGDAARLVPIEWCLSNMNPDASIYLDDASRPEERKIIETVCGPRRGIETKELGVDRRLVRFALSLSDPMKPLPRVQSVD